MKQALKNFCQTYEISNLDTITQQYEIGELMLFLPPQPNAREKEALQNLIARVGKVAYMEDVKTDNTFELIRQWRNSTRGI